MKKLIPLMIVMMSCSTPMTAQTKSVKLLRHSDPPRACKELGYVKGGSLFTVDQQSRENSLRQNAHKIGADTVTLDSMDANNILHGRAFKCS